MLRRVTVLIPDDVEEAARMHAAREGYHQGALSKLLTKALIDYIPELREKYSGLEARG